MLYQQDFNVFIGGKTGILKGLHLNDEKVIVKNLHNVKNLSSGSEITALTWGDTNETDILIGTKEQTVKIYDTEFKAFSSCMKTMHGEGSIVGITRFNNVITTCTSSGHIKVWKYNKEKEIELDTKGHVEKMQGTAINSGIVVTGGRGNDLKLWDLTSGEKLFVAKNVKKNELDVEVPVWVSDIAVLPDTEFKVAVSSRYGHVRLYDTKAQRRPVVECSIPDQSLQTISLAHRDHLFVVGSGTGYVLMVDFRMGGPNRVVSSFKGATGCVRQVACHKTKPYLASVGLDSYFRLHNLDNKKLLHQQFMQVKLNAVLMRSLFTFEREEDFHYIAEPSPKPSKATEEMDRVFEGMETIGGKRQLRTQ